MFQEAVEARLIDGTFRGFTHSMKTMVLVECSSQRQSIQWPIVLGLLLSGYALPPSLWSACYWDSVASVHYLSKQ
jgi:hypothetical protein